MVESDDLLGVSIRDNLRQNSMFITTMQTLHDGMEMRQRRSFGWVHLGELEKLERLDKEGDHCFEGLREIIAQFSSLMVI